VVCILTGIINGSFLTLIADAEHTDSNKYCGNKECESTGYDYVIPASKTQRVRVIVTGNAAVTMFNNLAQSKLNAKHIWQYCHYVVKMYWNWVL
jgi:hypothetical protein